MTALSKKDPIFIFVGDIAIFFISLWVMFIIRYQQIPEPNLVNSHLVSFSILFVLWILVFFIAGLYEKRIVVLRNNLPTTIIKAQITNIVVAVLFFYFIPYFDITPKTNLFIYLFVSLVLILLWRLYGYSVFGQKRKQNALLIAPGEELKELRDVVNNSTHYSLQFVSTINLDTIPNLDFKKEIIERIETNNISIIVADFKNEKVEPLLPALYSLIFSRITLIGIHKVYEDVFDRIPLSIIKHGWFLENVSIAPKTMYDGLKRIMDIVIAGIGSIVSLVMYPFVIGAIKLDDGGPVFISQERIGKDGRMVKIYKFRSMRQNNANVADDSKNVITKVGAFLRKTRIDELPQLWNVLRGDLSLIGPRPEFPSYVKLYEKEIPYYGVRHLIKPGLSGWAQIYHDNHPHHAVAVEATKEKLSYDLFYLKNRSFILDVTIALKTIKKLLSRSGV